MEGLQKTTQENKIEKGKIKEGVDFVFEQNPELIKIGTKEQYSEYLDTIFPNSKIKDILYTGSREPFDEFKEEKTFGTYFGSWISHYYGPKGRGYKHRTAAILNIEKPRILNRYILGSEESNHKNNEGISPSGASVDIKTFYNMTDEDGIIDINNNTSNQDVDYKEGNKLFEADFQKMLDSIFGVDFVMNEPGVPESVLLRKVHEIIKKAINNGGVEFGNIVSEVIVFEKEQIHRLGSDQDIEGFKKFVENNNDSQS